MSEDPSKKVTPIAKPATGNDPKKDDGVEIKERKTRKIQIDVNRDPEITALQEELAQLKEKQKVDEKSWTEEKATLTKEKEGLTGDLKEKTSILEKQALEKFESEKAAILKLCQESGLDEDKIADIEEKLASPKNLEIVKGLVQMLIPPKPAKETPDPKEGKGKDGKPIKKPTVKGKSTFVPPENATKYASDRAMVDEIYRRIRNVGKKYTVQEVNEAKAKRDTLFKTLIGSKSWQQMREGVTIGKHQRMACPKCQDTIIGKVPDKCGKCGFNFTKTGDQLAGRG